MKTPLEGFRLTFGRQKKTKLTGPAVLHHHNGTEKHQDLYFSLQQKVAGMPSAEIIWVGKRVTYGNKTNRYPRVI